MENIGFFLAPFAVLFCLLSEIEWSTTLLRRALVAIGVVAVACSVLGDLSVLRSRPLPQSRAVRRKRAPRLLPGQLDLLRPEHLRPLPRPRDRRAGACMAWGASRRELAASAIVGALALVALAFSYSITSFAALLAGLGVARDPALGLARPRRLPRRSARSGSSPWRSPAARRTATSRTCAASTPATADLIKGWPRARRRPPDLGLADRDRFGRALLRAHRAGADDRLALRADHGRRRAGRDRPARLRGAAGLRAGDAAWAPGPDRPLMRTLVAACFVAILVDSLGYTGLHDRPGDLGAARARRCPREVAPRAAVEAPDGASARGARHHLALSVRLPAPPGDDGRRVHGLERPLEADRGLPAAGLHGALSPADYGAAEVCSPR